MVKKIILFLFIDALVVCILQAIRSPFAWWFIVLYWGVLTIKNLIDYKGGK